LRALTAEPTPVVRPSRFVSGEVCYLLAHPLILAIVGAEVGLQIVQSALFPRPIKYGQFHTDRASFRLEVAMLREVRLVLEFVALHHTKGLAITGCEQVIHQDDATVPLTVLNVIDQLGLHVGHLLELYQRPEAVLVPRDAAALGFLVVEGEPSLGTLLKR